MVKVLLVEDDQLLVRLYTKKFTNEGYQIESAGDGSEGMVKAQNNPPDIILLDLMMPKASGFDMLQELQGSPRLKNIPVLILTNVSSDQDEQKARQLGATEYLVKADNPPDLVVERVVELLASKDAGEDGG